MAEMFEAKLRRVGNSVGIIIPKEVIETAGYDIGDTIPVSISKPDFTERNKMLRLIAGSCKGAAPFVREKEDRY